MTAPRPILAIVDFMASSRGHCALAILVLLALVLGPGYLASCSSLSCASPPLSVFDLQFVGTHDGAVALLRQLARGDHVAAVISCTAWDFAFIAAYVAGASTLFAYVARREPKLGADARYTIRVILTVAVFDIVEDFSLLMLLRLDAGGPAPNSLGIFAGATTLAALGKWMLLLWMAGATIRLLMEARGGCTGQPG